MRVFGRQRELKEIFSTREYEMIGGGTSSFADKSRTSKAKKESLGERIKKESIGERIKPDEIESRMFADLRLQHEQYLQRGAKNSSRFRDSN